MSEKVERRGGARPNSGPKPQTLSARQLELMVKEVKRRARREKKTVMGVMLDLVYGQSTSDTLKIQAAKLILDKTTIQVGEGGEADKALGPAVFLPEQRPTLKSIEGGKAA
jgi:hypothetical protein